VASGIFARRRIIGSAHMARASSSCRKNGVTRATRAKSAQRHLDIRTSENQAMKSISGGTLAHLVASPHLARQQRKDTW